MAWISAAATRNRFVAMSKADRSLRAETGGIVFSTRNLVTAWLSGDAEVMREEEGNLMKPTHLSESAIARPPNTLLVSLASSLLLRRCAGEDVNAELDRIAHLKGYKENSPRMVQAALLRILEQRWGMRAAETVGYPDSEVAFRRLAERFSPPTPAQLALVPDGPLWGRIVGVVIPLSYEALCASGITPTLASLATFIHAGADSRKRDVIYERSSDMSSGVWREDANEVPGFDAVELTDSRVVVHHYMGVRWQAPLLLDDDVNAFQFLEHVDRGWDEVKAVLSEDSWQRLSDARASLPTRHRVSIDPENAMEVHESTERARKRYGVELEVVGFLDA